MTKLNIILVFILINILGVWLASKQVSFNKSQLLEDTQQHADDLTFHIDIQTEEFISSLTRMVRRQEHNGENEFDEAWRNDAENYINNFPGLLSIEYYPVINEQENSEISNEIPQLQHLDKLSKWITDQQLNFLNNVYFIKSEKSSDIFYLLFPFEKNGRRHGLQIATVDLRTWTRSHHENESYFNEYFSSELIIDQSPTSSKLIAIERDSSNIVASTLYEYLETPADHSKFILAVAPTDQYADKRLGFSPYAIVITFTFIAGLVSYLLALLQNNRSLIAKQTNTEQKLRRELVVREEAEKALSDSSKQLLDILNSIQVTTITMTPDGNIAFINDFGARLLGYDKQELINRNVKVLMTELDAVHHDMFINAYLTTGNKKIIGKPREIKVKTKSGNEIIGQLSVVDASNAHTRFFVGAIVDLSAQKRLQNFLKNEADEAKKASLSKSQFMSKMTHEIKTPLNAVLGSIQLLQKLETNKEHAKLITTALKSSVGLVNIINDILDLSKIESGQMNFQNDAFSFRDIIKRISTDTQDQRLKNNVRVSYRFSEGFKNNLVGDETHIRQVVHNLVGNAIKFSPNGDVLVSVDIEDDTNTKDSFLVVRVEDNGLGISKVVQRKLFVPFQQADNTKTRKFGGTGLGLALCKQICNKLGGDISCKSKLGEGSIFKVVLPISVVTEPEESVKSDAVSEVNYSNIPELQNLRVLIVEDNEINVEVLTSLLGPLHCKVKVAMDGISGLEQYRLFKPNIILMDIHMPGLDGIAACKILRNQGAEIPIIAVTANVSRLDIESYNMSGFSDIVAKPVLQNVLFEKMAACCANYIRVYSSA